MKKYKFTEEQMATWGGAVFFVLLAVILLAVFRVGMPAPAAQIEDVDATLVAQRLEEILQGGTPAAAPPSQAPQAALAPGATSTPACEQMKLEIGVRAFEVQPVARFNGDVQIPGDTNDTAYWVEDTGVNMVFLLSPTIENLSLVTSLTEGQTGKVTWPDCSWKEYSLQTVQPAGADLTGYFEQSNDGITIVIRDGTSYTLVVAGSITVEEIVASSAPLPQVVVTAVQPSGQVSAATSALPRQEVTAAPTAAPEAVVLPDLSEYDNILAEIELKNVSRTGDMMRIDISIKNMGQSDLYLRNIDISLHAENSYPILSISSQPSLPQKIEPLETKVLSVLFASSATSKVILRIYSGEFDLDDF